MNAPPLVDQRVLEALLSLELPRARDKGAGVPRLVLVHGRYRPGAPTGFTLRIGERQHRVSVSDQHSVLGVIDAWEAHNSTAAEAGSILVITSGVDGQLGADIRGHALGRRALSVDRAEIVKQRFGAIDLDPRIRVRDAAWLVEALLNAEPADGWRDHPAAAAWRRGGGGVLTRDAALRALIEIRLDLADVLPGEPAAGRDLDTGTLLAWSRSPGASARFRALGPAERNGITAWLRQTAGDAAGVLLDLVNAGRGEDAMALGAVAAVLQRPDTDADMALAVGGLLAGVQAHPDEVRAFASAVQGTLIRWINEAERRGHQAARDRVLDVLERADELARSAGLTAALATDPFLPSGFDERLRNFASALRESAQDTDDALEHVLDHRLARLYRDRCHVAEMAARLRRWLAVADGDAIPSVAAGVGRHLAEWGWVDYALNILWAGDAHRDPVLGHAYRTLYEQGRRRREILDHRFAERLVRWTASASAEAPGGALLVESVLTEVVRPLAAKAPPLVVVLDGMSASVAAQLGEELARSGRWTEITAVPGQRRAAVSMIPSVTRVSRASLLAGMLGAGGPQDESRGFAEFWRRHRKETALFHKSTIAGDAGHRLADSLLEALSRDHVVGVVLNTIDDALDHDREGDRTDWQVGHITFLTDLLDAARAYNRPVVLVADHGHVLERGPRDSGPVQAPGVGGARWRQGDPADGEIELTGPRVMEGGGSVTVPWREDVRYTPRKAGYHGGASLAEMTVPVLVLLPSPDLLPKDWAVLPPEEATPSWWRTGTAEPAPAAATRDPRAAVTSSGDVPAAERPTPTSRSLGTAVVSSPVYAEQRRYLRKAPDAKQVGAVIDALASAGGSLSLPAVGAAALEAGGRPPRDITVFTTALERLLNVEGYPVLRLVDSGRTAKLNVPLLREQFQAEEEP